MEILSTISGTIQCSPGIIDYQSTAISIPLTHASGVPLGKATVFSYERTDNVIEGSERPLIVAFNGGPGSSSSWLHLSGIATHTVATPPPGSPIYAAGSPLILSSSSLLDVADLLFVDPIGTGFGRLHGEAEADWIYGTESEAEYFADIVRSWMHQRERLTCPVYLLGESFGTVRAPLLANYLRRESPIIEVRGLALMGQSLNLQETADRPANVMSVISDLGLFAATAFFHGKAEGPSLNEHIDRALSYSRDVLVPALIQGNQLAAQQRRCIANELQSLTGVKAYNWEKFSLKIPKPEFLNLLLEGSCEVLGRYDTRYSARTWDSRRGNLPVDPSLNVMDTCFSSAMNEYLRTVFKIQSSEQYVFDNEEAFMPWKWAVEGSTYSMAPSDHPSAFDVYDHGRTLSIYLHSVPDAKVLLGNGVFDSLTTVGSAELLAGTLDLPPEQLLLRRYEGGHMMYTNPDSALQFSNDLRELIGTQRGKQLS